MNSKTQKLVNYLSIGISNIQIAKALGESESTISQLASREDVIKAVEKEKQANAIEEVDELAQLKRTKSTILGQIEILASSSESLGECSRALTVIDGMVKDRTVRERNPDQDDIEKLTINAPVFIQQIIQVNRDSRSQVIDIAGQSMAPMNMKDVHNLIDDGGNEDVNAAADIFEDSSL